MFVILLCSLALHEFGHAFAADKRGDPLPRQQGRVTLNPLAHLTLIGSLIIPGIMIFAPLLAGSMPFALIGWGKPVEVSLPNPKTRRLDDIIITLAGPGVNVVLALLGTVAAGVVIGLHPESINHGTVLSLVLLPLIWLNVMLAVFNMLPIPPLDGSHLLKHATGMSDSVYYFLSRWGWLVLLIAINIPAVSNLFGNLLEGAVRPFIKLAFIIGKAIAGGAIE
jgi:Zn-dependent protease